MTRKEIRDEIISIIGSDTELQNADYDKFIDEGHGNIVARIMEERKDFFPDTETISVVASDVDITPTKTWSNITLIQIDFGEGDGYVTMNKDSLERVLNQTTSNVFHLWGDVIYVPDFKKAFTMRIFGYVVHTFGATDGSVPAFSVLLHPLLVTWGIGRAIEASSASENFLDGQRKQAEFWNTLDLILPTVILKDMTNVKSLV